MSLSGARISLATAEDNPGMLTSIAAAIIDLDGTMLDTAPDFHVNISRMRTDFDLTSLSLQIITNFVGKESENLIRRVLSLDLPEADVDANFNAGLVSYQSHYLAINGSFATLSNVIAGLQPIQDMELRMVCVTNKPTAFALPLLEKTGLRDFLEPVYGGDSFFRENQTRCHFWKCATNATYIPHNSWLLVVLRMMH